MEEPTQVFQNDTACGDGTKTRLKSTLTGWIHHLAILAAYFIMATCVTWPLLLHMSSAIPVGTEREATVPLFNLWTLWWTADRIDHGLRDYWDAPMFYPNPGAFSYSEPQPLTGLALWPLWAAGLSPILIYNMAILLILTLNGWCAYRLLYTVSSSIPVSLSGGFLIVALPFTAKELGVLPLLPVFGTLVALEGLARFNQCRKLRYAVAASLGYIAQFLASQQLALLGAPFIGAAGLLTLWRVRDDRRALRHLLIAGLVAVVLIVGLMLPIMRLHRVLDFERPFELVKTLSATPSDFLSRPGTSILTFPPPESPNRDTAGLFPGLLVLLLATYGIVSIPYRPHRRVGVLFLTAMVAGSFLLSLGLNVDIAGWHPFWTIRNIVPGMDRLRSPFRFALFTQIGLSLLAATALVRVTEWRPGPTGRSLALTLGLFAAAENLAIPEPLAHVPSTPHSEWAEWLKNAPDQTIVAHIPFPEGPHVSHYEIETWRQFAQIEHRKRIVNGYSGFFPPGYLGFQLDMSRNFPNRELLCLMATRLRVNTVVIDQSWLATHGDKLRSFSNHLNPRYHDNSVAIFHLTMPQAECATMQ